MKPLRLAFMGCGFATRLHSRTLNGRSDIERYYASRDPARAAEYSRKYRGRGYFGSYDAALHDTSIDIIFVATPPDSHLDLTLQALSAGKHVIVEKPPFLLASDFDAVEASAREAGRRVFIAENYFYKPLLAELRETISSGAIGQPLIISINALKAQRTGDWRDLESVAGGGALFEGGIHWVNFMSNLGLTVSSARGYRPGSQEGPEKTIVVVFEYAEGTIGTLYYSWEIGSPTKGLRLSSIYGTDGAVTFETNGLGMGVRGRTKRLSLPKPRDLLGYGSMFDDFFQAIRTGAPARFELADARRDLELIEEIYSTLPPKGGGGA